MSCLFFKNKFLELLFLGIIFTLNSCTNCPKKNSKLPRIFLNTGEDVTEKKQLGTLNCDSLKGIPIFIKVRGSSSKQYPKKSFSLQFDKKSISLLSLPSSKKWVLYAPYADRTAIRNKLVYKLFKQMGYWSPSTAFCSLYYNENYNGLYELIEKPDLTPNKINNGRFLLKIDKRSGKQSYRWPSAYSDSLFFEFDEPNENEINNNDLALVKDKIDLFEKSIFYDRKNLNAICDENSLIDFFIMQEFGKNPDAYRSSVFFSIGMDDKIHMGPLWDYDFAFGNSKQFNSFKTEGWMFNENNFNPIMENKKPDWWKILYEDPLFKQKIKARWNNLKIGNINSKQISQWIDSISNTIKNDIDANNRKWNVIGTTLRWNYYNGKTYKDEINYLKQWIENRINWMDREINK